MVFFTEKHCTFHGVVLFTEKCCTFHETVLFTEKQQKQLIQHRSLIMTWCFIEYRGKVNWAYLTFWGYLVVHVCVYGAWMHTYVSSFVLYDFIVDSMKSNTILLKPNWFHEISNDFMKSNWILQRVTRFHKINSSLQDYIKSRRISWNLSEFH